MKSCTPLWREAHFKVKMCKTQHVRTTLGRSTAPHYTTTTPTHNYNYNYSYSTQHYLDYTTLQLQLQLRYITLHYTAYTRLHYSYNQNYNCITLYYTTLDYTTLYYTTDATLQYTTLHYTTLYSCSTPQLQLQVQLQRDYINYTAPRYTTKTTTALHHTTSSNCG